VDRRKKGSKHHLLTDACGTPMSSRLTAANRNDVTQLLTLIDAVPPVAGKPGRPRRRFERVQGDRAYHSDPLRAQLRKRGSRPLLARHRVPHGSGLGKHRWPIERSFSWLHRNRRLGVRYEKRDDIHEAFMLLGQVMICWKTLHRRKRRFC
jgi:transposase